MSTLLSSLIVPQRLSPGDKIATVSLSWGGAGNPSINPRYQRAIRHLEEKLGLRVVEMANTLKGSDFLYDHVQARVDDLHQAFSDPDIKAVINCIGGDDAIRMINKVDFDLLRKNPKIFLGYSDSTIPHFLCLKAGIRSYYGPNIITSFTGDEGPHPYLIDSLKVTLFGKSPVGELHPSPQGWSYEDMGWLMPAEQGTPRELFPELPWNFIQGKSAVSGRLLGGCADALPTITGTSIWPIPEAWNEAILFLENFGAPMSPDAFLAILRNLGAQGIISRINGIIFGRPDRVSPDRFAEYDQMLIKATREYDRPDLPIVTQMDFGHTEPMLILPYGAIATIDPVRKTFSIDEVGCA